MINLWKNSVTDAPSLLIFLAVASVSIIFSTSPAIMVLLAGAAGIIINSLKTSHTIQIFPTDDSSADRQTAVSDRCAVRTDDLENGNGGEE